MISMDEDFDGEIDWWIPHPDYRGINEIYDPTPFSNPNDSVFGDIEWIDVFPVYVNVLDAKFFIAPDKQQDYV